eukprot:6176829-Pleurochrysis_carterae.AAC.1
MTTAASARALRYAQLFAQRGASGAVNERGARSARGKEGGRSGCNGGCNGLAEERLFIQQNARLRGRAPHSGAF